MAPLYADVRDLRISYDLNPDKREIRDGTEVTEQKLTFGLSELEVLARQLKSTVRKPKHQRSVSIIKFTPGPSPLSNCYNSHPNHGSKSWSSEARAGQIIPKGRPG